MPRLLLYVSKLTFVALMILVAIGVAAIVFVPQFTPAREGCYWTNAMIGYIECPNVSYGKVIEFVLNLPFFVFLYYPMIGAYSIWNLKFGFFSIVILIDILILCLGILYLSRLLRKIGGHRSRRVP